VDMDVDIGEYCHPLTTGGSIPRHFYVSRRISHPGPSVVIPLISSRDVLIELFGRKTDAILIPVDHFHGKHQRDAGWP